MAESGQMGHNSELSEDQMRALGFHHKGLFAKALEAKKATDAAFRNTCKKAIADGVSVNDIKLLIALDSPEGEAELKAELNRKIQVSRWAGSDIGTQFSFLDEPDRTPLDDRAYEEGKRAGMEATDRKAPYDGAAEQAWLRGYHDGQQALMSALDLTAAGMAEIAAAAEAEDAEPKKRGRPKGAKNKERAAKGNGDAAEPDDAHAADKARDAESFADPFPAA